MDEVKTIKDAIDGMPQFAQALTRRSNTPPDQRFITVPILRYGITTQFHWITKTDELSYCMGMFTAELLKLGWQLSDNFKLDLG